MFTPKAKAKEELSAGEVGFVIAGDQGTARRQGRRHHDARGQARRPSRCRASRRSSRRCSPACTRSRPTSTRRCATRWRSCTSTTPRSTTSPRPRRRSASASAAASSACCTWTSCRSAWSASTACSLITTAPSVVYEVKLRDGTLRAAVEPVAPAVGGDDRGVPRADHGLQDLRAAGVRRPGDHAVHREARHADQHALLGAPRGDLLRPAAERGGDGLLRPPEVGDARLRLARLRVQGVPRRRHGAARHPGERREGRRAVEHGAPLGRAAARARAGHQAESH